MWKVYEHRRIDKQLQKLPVDILKKYEKWKDIVEISGPSGLRLIRGFRDEALRGEWKGHRSSRLGQQYRIIYKVDGERLLVEVVEVNPHDYRRKN
ncbi:MAG: type II toxin-antitoxin system mRNA interferase toxin, RelE/StbE family [Pseudomonadales bacterium]|nr:type II toxin-antitoxin system mRNA interferase toxin, RelE/StbE family [Pseudomonadales bacterium]MBO7006185.1 type II toxin-antitoxin system mRNA interferase toxin, RelE/StbE family [Pseudomonadales bacterium]